MCNTYTYLVGVTTSCSHRLSLLSKHLPSSQPAVNQHRWSINQTCILNRTWSHTSTWANDTVIYANIWTCTFFSYSVTVSRAFSMLTLNMLAICWTRGTMTDWQVRQHTIKLLINKIMMNMYEHLTHGHTPEHVFITSSHWTNAQPFTDNDCLVNVQSDKWPDTSNPLQCSTQWTYIVMKTN